MLHIKTKQLFVSVVVFLCFSAGLLFALDKSEIQQINQAIKAKGASWTAGENWVTRLSKEEQRKLLGTLLEPEDKDPSKYIDIPLQNDLPEKFDWRDNNGNWLTPVTNQGNCGSCWAFSAVAQTETWWKITNNLPDTALDLSEQFVLSCSDGGCDGWSIYGALEFIRTTGVPLEECMTYQADDQIPCDSACADWEANKVTIPGWGFVTLEEADVQKIKNAVYLHPLSVSYVVYEDFYSYTGGVYEHVWGEVAGGHAVLIVGWDDSLECWIVKNSWGKNWGENGYFRIKWGDSGMGSWSPFIWDNLTDAGSLAFENKIYEYSLTRGDSVAKYITLTNTGSQPLYYAAFDYLTNYFFHVDSYGSYDGQSWWCGDPEIQGYDNHWLQWMQTPILDLSTTSTPKMNCMVKWSVEDPAGASDTDPNYDGWDGCNVWISTDGGKNFQVLSPTTPDYTCQSLWSFGHPEQGWNYGYGIAGWAGKSSGWQPAEFDLSAFKEDSVVIRFALASDMAYATADNQTLKGYFVDEIVVADGGNTIFENHGEDDGSIEIRGRGAVQVPEWLALENGVGVIAPNSTAEMGLIFNTKELDPKTYHGTIIFSFNSPSNEMMALDWTLNLNLPDHDLAIKEVTLPGKSIPLFFPITFGAKVRNEGSQTETDVEVVLTATMNGNVIYRDTTVIASIASWEEATCSFEPYLFSDSGKVDFSLTLPNFSGDYNPKNNAFYTSTTVSNLVDDFEGETGFWTFAGGWGFSTISAHSGTQCVHVNGGKVPYNNNMNSLMMFKPGFDVTAINSLKLKFWAKYLMEAGKDFLYVEGSTDKTNWQTLYTMTGNYYREWQQHVVELSDLITPEASKVYVRFRFVSDEQNPSIGALIDDIEVFEGRVSDVPAPVAETIVPDNYELKQNFPNPFNMETMISYNLPEKSEVKLTIFNINGEIVKVLENGLKPSGAHQVRWDGRDEKGQIVGTGVYFYQLEISGKFKDTKKLLLLK